MIKVNNFMQVVCIKCGKTYIFSNRWFKTNNPDKFICRSCKIKNTTRSKEFRRNAKENSINKLSDVNIKNKLSQIAILNNLKNADKISKSLKHYYSSNANKNKLSKLIKDRWQNEEYRSKISNSMMKKWKDPVYRGNILGSRTCVNNKNKHIIKKLNDKNITYIVGFCLGSYEFELLINNIYLYDTKIIEEKRIFIEHYFSDYDYIDNIKMII